MATDGSNQSRAGSGTDCLRHGVRIQREGRTPPTGTAGGFGSRQPGPQGAHRNASSGADQKSGEYQEQNKGESPASSSRNSRSGVLVWFFMIAQSSQATRESTAARLVNRFQAGFEPPKIRAAHAPTKGKFADPD